VQRLCMVNRMRISRAVEFWGFGSIPMARGMI
jgi:hypothetical protein